MSARRTAPAIVTYGQAGQRHDRPPLASPGGPPGLGRIAALPVACADDCTARPAPGAASPSQAARALHPAARHAKPLGIFGGTFDPIHFGHLRLAEEAAECLELSSVLWIPAGQPPHRAVPQVTARHRLDMVRLAIAGNPVFSLDPAEVEAAQPSYTVLTLERLRAEYGWERSLVLLVGADAFAGLPSWHRWRDLFGLAHIAVSHRPGFPVHPESLSPELAEEFRQRSIDPAGLRERAAGSIVSFAMTQLAISATQIRQLLANHRSLRYLVPPAVIDYIETNHLYRNI